MNAKEAAQDQVMIDETQDALNYFYEILETILLEPDAEKGIGDYLSTQETEALIKFLAISKGVNVLSMAIQAELLTNRNRAEVKAVYDQLQEAREKRIESAVARA